MLNNVLHRSLSLCLAAVLTVAMLGSIDRLARQDPLPAQWAQQSAVRA